MLLFDIFTPLSSFWPPFCFHLQILYAVFKKTRENHQINLKLSPIVLCRNLLVFRHQKQVNILKTPEIDFFLFWIINPENFVRGV